MEIKSEKPFYRIRSKRTGKFYAGTEVKEYGTFTGTWAGGPYRYRIPTKIITKWAFNSYRICVLKGTLKRWLKEIEEYKGYKHLVIEKCTIGTVEVVREINL